MCSQWANQWKMSMNKKWSSLTMPIMTSTIQCRSSLAEKNISHVLVLIICLLNTPRVNPSYPHEIIELDAKEKRVEDTRALFGTWDAPMPTPPPSSPPPTDYPTPVTPFAQDLAIHRYQSWPVPCSTYQFLAVIWLTMLVIIVFPESQYNHEWYW